MQDFTHVSYSRLPICDLLKSFQSGSTSLRCNFLTISFSKVFLRTIMDRDEGKKNLSKFDSNQKSYAFIFFQSFILSFHTLPTIDSSTGQHHATKSNLREISLKIIYYDAVFTCDKLIFPFHTNLQCSNYHYALFTCGQFGFPLTNNTNISSHSLSNQIEESI